MAADLLVFSVEVAEVCVGVIVGVGNGVGETEIDEGTESAIIIGSFSFVDWKIKYDIAASEITISEKTNIMLSLLFFRLFESPLHPHEVLPK